MMNESPYIEIAANIDEMAIRAPRSKSGEGFSEAFLKYLQLLFTPEEAEIARHLKVAEDLAWVTFNPMRLMTPIQLAKVSGQPLSEVNKALKQMSEKNVVLNIRKAIKGSDITWPVRTVAVLRKIYQAEGLKEILRILKVFFTSALYNAREYGIKSGYEFLSMKLYAFPQMPYIINIQNVDTRITPEVLRGAELYKEYFINEKYSRFYQTGAKGTPLMRTIPVSKSLAPQEKILDTEEAHKIIDAAAYAALVPCPCRTRTEKIDTRKCRENNPVGSCIMMGLLGMATEGFGVGKEVTKQQAKDYLDEMMEKGLVATTHNTEDTTSALICLCCGCCCSQTRGRIAWGNPTAVAPSNFFPKTDRRICTFCGTCAERCMFHAITVDKESRKWRLNPELCIGCGICALGCGQGAVKLHRKDRSSPFKTRQDLYSQIDRENR
jgi:Pyruvate/2-oxoacid:ferredoxin oxidoreductase delta subunit